MIYFQLKYPEKKEQKKHHDYTNAMFSIGKKQMYSLKGLKHAR